MEMSHEEIKRDYITAKNPEKQIKILADLNACSVEEIKNILGIKPPLKRLQEELSGDVTMEIWLQKKMDEADQQIKAWEEKYKSYASALKVFAEYKERGNGQ
ncbi:MAG: hypothetical protein K6G30_12060 [Acetatifactor sp.]|nr:hypothetical protein [Acetatifactor sp.]